MGSSCACRNKIFPSVLLPQPCALASGQCAAERTTRGAMATVLQLLLHTPTEGKRLVVSTRWLRIALDRSESPSVVEEGGSMSPPQAAIPPQQIPGQGGEHDGKKKDGRAWETSLLGDVRGCWVAWASWYRIREGEQRFSGRAALRGRRSGGATLAPHRTPRAHPPRGHPLTSVLCSLGGDRDGSPWWLLAGILPPDDEPHSCPTLACPRSHPPRHRGVRRRRRFLRDTEHQQRLPARPSGRNGAEFLPHRRGLQGRSRIHLHGRGLAPLLRRSRRGGSPPSSVLRRRGVLREGLGGCAARVPGSRDLFNLPSSLPRG
jgi:hypothetical protein